MVFSTYGKHGRPYAVRKYVPGTPEYVIRRTAQFANKGKKVTVLSKVRESFGPANNNYTFKYHTITEIVKVIVVNCKPDGTVKTKIMKGSRRIGKIGEGHTLGSNPQQDLQGYFEGVKGNLIALQKKLPTIHFSLSAIDTSDQIVSHVSTVVEGMSPQR